MCKPSEDEDLLVNTIILESLQQRPVWICMKCSPVVKEYSADVMTLLRLSKPLFSGMQ